MTSDWLWCSRKEQRVNRFVCRKRCDKHEDCEELIEFEVDQLVMPEIEDQLNRLGLNSLAALRNKIAEP